MTAREKTQLLYCKWCPHDCQDLTKEEKLGCLASGGFVDEHFEDPEIGIISDDQSLPEGTMTLVGGDNKCDNKQYKLSHTSPVCPECEGVGELLAVDFGYPPSDANWKCHICHGSGLKPPIAKIMGAMPEAQELINTLELEKKPLDDFATALMGILVDNGIVLKDATPTPSELLSVVKTLADQSPNKPIDDEGQKPNPN